MALKFNCSKCGEIIIVKFVKPGSSVNCGKCRATNIIPTNAVGIDDDQADDNTRPQTKARKGEVVVKTAEKTAVNNEPSFKKAQMFACWGAVGGIVLGFLIPSNMSYEYGMERWMVVLSCAVIFGIIGFVTGEFMRPADSVRAEVNNSVPQNRYPALRAIIGYYRVLAGILIIFTVIICISFFIGGPAGFFWIRVLGAMATGLLGMALYVTLRATAEGITVFLDIEENTRKIHEKAV